MNIDFNMKSMVNSSMLTKEWLVLGLIAAAFVNFLWIFIPNVSINDLIVVNISVPVGLYSTKCVVTFAYNLENASRSKR